MTSFGRSLPVASGCIGSITVHRDGQKSAKSGPWNQHGSHI